MRWGCDLGIVEWLGMGGGRVVIWVCLRSFWGGWDRVVVGWEGKTVWGGWDRIMGSGGIECLEQGG